MNMLALTIILPLIGFVLLAFSRGRWSENLSATIGVGSVGLAALVTAFVGMDFFANGKQAFSQPLWTWMSVGNFNIGFNLVLDGLSLTMLSVVTGVGFLIHMFASWYMRGEEGYSRFFAYTNLFIASMVVLVLSDNLLLMYLGWEGVGLCSYLLIGFYYSDPKNGAAAMKAFVVTRVGDVFLAFALFILYNELGTLNFREMVELAPAHFADGNNMLMWATLMLLGGAVGKSAQLPLQTWLADAMAGPTPVSALIHAATMVTAGVYLIARTHGLFLMTPEILHLVGIIGAITRADPRRHHGYRRCLPDCTHAWPVPDDPGNSASGGHYRGDYAGNGRFRRAGADRHQTRAGLFHHEPDWLHVPGARRTGVGCGDFPPDDARLL